MYALHSITWLSQLDRYQISHWGAALAPAAAQESERVDAASSFLCLLLSWVFLYTKILHLAIQWPSKCVTAASNPSTEHIQERQRGKRRISDRVLTELYHKKLNRNI